MNDAENAPDPSPAYPSFFVLGVRITPLTADQWLGVVRDGIESRQRRLLVSQNLHSTFLATEAPAIAAVQGIADVVRIDGMPLVWVGKLLGLPITRQHRSGFMDLMPKLMSVAAASGWKILVIAGRPGVAERAAAELRSRHAGLDVVTESGYFDLSDSDGEVSRRLSRISAEKPDMVLIGMGMPRQEEFLMRYMEKMAAPVVGTCGAAFDYVAGVIPMAPRWLSALGLEWLFRLLAEPRRLWRRYLLEPLALLPRLCGDLRAKWLGLSDFTAPREQHR